MENKIEEETKIKEAETEEVTDSEEITEDTEEEIPKGQRLAFFIKCCPIVCRVFISIALFSVILFILFCIFPSFSDFYNRYPGAFFRMILAKITGWFPFSLAECIIMLMPFLIVGAVILVYKAYKKTVKEMMTLFFALLSVCSYLFSSFVLGFAASYRGTSLSSKLGLEQNDVTAEELYETAVIILDEIDKVIDEIAYSGDGSSVMPMSFSEMNDELQTAYKKASEKYTFLPVYKTTVKQIVLSEPMTYTHISGVYSYFTGESNVNTNFPDYNLPYTAAHELAHQRGIGPEDEANLVAYLVSIESDNSYIKYSAYMNMFEYFINALYSADKSLYSQLISETDTRCRCEISAFNSFFEKYEKNVAATVSNKVNDTYLKSQGQESGSDSYGLVVDLTVAFYKNKTE